MTSDYHRRLLTYDGDTLFALAGATSALSQTFRGGFLCGLPELFFDNAMLWNYCGGFNHPSLAEYPPGLGQAGQIG
jgi:hypothetical protein